METVLAFRTSVTARATLKSRDAVAISVPQGLHFSDLMLANILKD